MNNSRKLIALTTVLLLVCFAMLSCSRDAGPSPESSSSSSLANADDNKACQAPISHSNPNETRASQVEKRLMYWVGKDTELADTLQVKVDTVNDKFLEVFVWGEARGDDELEDFYQIVRKFMHKDEKKGCVRTVKFVPAGPGEPRTRGVAFEWSACEYPRVVCNSGECHEEPCPNLTGNANVNTNANANANVNSSPSSNGNSNSNAGSNVNAGATGP